MARALDEARGDVVEVIVEAFVNFQSEITLLTVVQKGGLPTLFCAPIGHRQERGDYMESWQPAVVRDEDLIEAQRMAGAVTEALGGAGIFGVEFFLADATGAAEGEVRRVGTLARALEEVAVDDRDAAFEVVDNV